MNSRAEVPVSAVARSAVALSAVIATVLSLGGRWPDARGHDPAESATRQSVLPLAVLAAVAVFVIGLSVLSFARSAAPRANTVGDSRAARRPVRMTRRQLFAIVAVLAGSAAAVAAVRHLVPPPAVQQPAARDSHAGETATRPGEPAPAPPDEGPLPLEEGPLRVLGVVSGATVLAALVATGIIAARSSRQRPASMPDEEAAMRTRLARAAARARTEAIDLHRDPRDVVLTCYRVLEQEFAADPRLSPTASDTPTEVLARAVGTDVVAADIAARLVALFAEARFSAHAMTERHRTEAAHLLDAVLSGLGGSDGERVR
ncbi:DUF4129 domain-containing protein [Nocardia asteroides]